MQRKIVDDGTRCLEKKTISAPPKAIDYTRYMKSQLWWRKIFYFLVNIARVNAWICYRKHHSTIHVASKSGKL